MLLFFKSRRRKFGLVTLAIACLLTAGWVRCQTIADLLYFTRGHKFYNLMSVENGVHLGTVQESSPPHPWGWEAERSVDSRFRRLALKPPNVDLQLCGIRLAAYGKGEGNGTLDLQFPYWSLVIPLIILSSAALLSMPRKPHRVTQSPGA